MKNVEKSQELLLKALEQSGMFLNGSQARETFEAAKKALSAKEVKPKK